MINIIMLSGASGAGKSSIAQMLVVEYCYQEVALATPIKRGLADITGLTIEEIEVKKNDTTSQVRQALQAIGEAACEKEDLYWVGLAANKMSAVTLNYLFPDDGRPQARLAGFVVPDVRKVYEAQFFPRYNAACHHIFIDRLSLDMSQAKYQHKTEQNLDALREMADIVIVNNFATVGGFLASVKAQLSKKGILN